MKSLHAIILAAGEGTRMKSDLPKVLHPICGRPMIAYALDLATACGVKQPIVLVGGAAEEVQPHLPKEAKMVIQKPPLGTGHAVLTAKRTLGALTGDVLILYADTPLLRRTTIQRLIETHQKSNATCTLLTAHLADPTGYGRVIRDATGLLTGIVEESDANQLQRAIREVNVGPLCVKVQPLFEALAGVAPSQMKKEWYLTQAIGIMAKQGAKFQTVRLERVTEATGVNSRLDLSKAAAAIRQRILEAHLNNGVTIVDPQATYIDHGVTIGQDTVIHPGTVIESGVVIGKRCAIGPFARLRSGVTVADETRVGNFVELVRTKVGSRVHVNHLAYLGDATVEDEVNIGAGTITANYDGASKSPTVIGKGAFIGCDTGLIAPVKVGPGAVTGAGSVIPKGHDVPPRGVVVGVPARPLERVSQPAPQPKKQPAAANKRAARVTPRRKPATRSAPKKRAAKKPAPPARRVRLAGRARAKPTRAASTSKRRR